MAADGENRGRGLRPVACQAVLMVQWLWSLSRLCVAETNRLSVIVLIVVGAVRPLRLVLGLAAG